MTTFYLFSILLVLAHFPKYHYADGSGNLWILQENKLEYQPMTPDRSSSGTYSGGTPYTKTITREQYTEARILCKRALRAKPSHQKAREMGTGVVTEFKKNGEEGAFCILKMESVEKEALENWLHAFNH